MCNRRSVPRIFRSKNGKSDNTGAYDINICILQLIFCHSCKVIISSMSSNTLSFVFSN